MTNRRSQVLYLSSAPSPEQFSYIRSQLRKGAQEVTYGMAAASFRFHGLILDGLSAQPETHVTSLVGRPVSPKFHGKKLWPSIRSQLANGTDSIEPGFLNVMGLKQACLAYALAREARIWEKKTRSAPERFAIVDASYITALPGVVGALRKREVPIIGIFADLYSYMADVSDAGERNVSIAFRLAREVMKKSINSMDGFVVLTEPMNDVINATGKPYIVMEGLADISQAARSVKLTDKTHNPTIMYAGALRQEYGLADLVDGFKLLPDPDVRLLIYGQGNFADTIRAAAFTDPRIDFRGSALVDEVLSEEEKAWILVNPRPADQEFTKYSFPSKNLEYLASGTPLLTTRLPGMPQDYYDYVLTIDSPGANQIAEALAHAISLGPERLHSMGSAGKNFVLKEKNNIKQADRIMNLCRQVVGAPPERSVDQNQANELP